MDGFVPQRSPFPAVFEVVRSFQVALELLLVAPRQRTAGLCLWVVRCGCTCTHITSVGDALGAMDFDLVVAFCGRAVWANGSTTLLLRSVAANQTLLNLPSNEGLLLQTLLCVWCGFWCV